MLSSEQWRLRLIAMLGLGAAGAACTTSPPPDPQEPVPTSALPEPEPDVLTAAGAQGTCGPDEMREIQCGVGMKPGGTKAPAPHAECPTSSDDLKGYGFSNMLRFDNIAKRDLPFDAKRTDKFAADSAKHTGAKSCCYSRCVALDTTPRNTPVPPGYQQRKRCIEALESPSNNPSEAHPQCPAGVMMNNGPAPYYARFSGTILGNVVGQLKRPMCCYQGIEPRPRRKYYRGRALNGPAGPVLAAPVASTEWLDAARCAPIADVSTQRHHGEARSADVSRLPAAVAVPLHDVGALDTQALAMPVEQALREALRDRWLAAAAEEHASVAAFSKLSLDLLSLGAPPELIADSHRAALDEIEHALFSYELGSAYGGEAVGPGRLATQLASRSGRAQLAEETFRDGCVGETVATLCALRAAEQTSCPQLAALQRRIAADEQRHAELAWRVVSWLLRDDEQARARVEAACAELLQQAQADRPQPPSAQDAALSPHGVLSATEEHAAVSEALEQIVAPCLTALLERRPTAQRAALS